MQLLYSLFFANSLVEQKIMKQARKDKTLGFRRNCHFEAIILVTYTHKFIIQAVDLSENAKPSSNFHLPFHTNARNNVSGQSFFLANFGQRSPRRDKLSDERNESDSSDHTYHYYYKGEEEKFTMSLLYHRGIPGIPGIPVIPLYILKNKYLLIYIYIYINCIVKVC